MENTIIEAKDILGEPETKEPVAEPTTELKKETEPKRKPIVSRYLNEVTLRGNIVKISSGKKVTAITLCTRAAITVSNYPTVMFFGDAGKKASEFHEGERVVIKATLQSYDESKLQKWQSPILVTGLSVVREDPCSETSHTSDELDLKPIEMAGHQDENKIEIRGQILAIECDSKGETVLTIRTVVGGRWSIIKYPYYARNTDYFLKNIYVHQYVRCVGMIQTANIPVEPEESEPAEESVLKRKDSRPPRIRTKKVQMYILFDVYPLK